MYRLPVDHFSGTLPGEITLKSQSQARGDSEGSSTSAAMNIKLAKPTFALSQAHPVHAPRCVPIQLGSPYLPSSLPRVPPLCVTHERNRILRRSLPGAGIYHRFTSGTVEVVDTPMPRFACVFREKSNIGNKLPSLTDF